MDWLFKSKSGKILVHLLVWIQVMAVPFIVRELFFTGEEPPKLWVHTFSGSNWILVVLFFSLMIGFFYLNAGVFVPRFLLQRRFGVYFLSIFLSLAVVIALVAGIIQSGWLADAEFFRQRRFLGLGAAFILFWFASLGYRMTKAWFRSEQALRDLENEKLKTELSYLQGQINPHFLFNTLNTIYTLAYQKSDRTAGSVLQLSNLLRYVLDSPPATAALEDEIRHLQDFIALHQLRLTAKTQVEFRVQGDTSGIRIAPMLMLPLVENAFKHGVSSHRESTIRFALDLMPGELRFKAENARFNSAGVETGRTGIGIQNLRRRLALLYPGKHRLEIMETAERYLAELNLQTEY